MKYQFTMFSEKYKPVSTIVEANFRMDFAQHKEPYKKAITQICIKRGWTVADLKKYGYGVWKVRKAEEE